MKKDTEEKQRHPEMSTSETNNQLAVCLVHDMAGENRVVENRIIVYKYTIDILLRTCII